MEFRENPKSYIVVVRLGLIAGLLIRLLDLFPSDKLWSLGSIDTLYVFWIITTTLVIHFK